MNTYADNVILDVKNNKKTKKSSRKLAVKRLLYWGVATGIYTKPQLKEMKKKLRAIGAW